MTGTMTWAAMDVHARSTYGASLDVMTGELSRQRFDTGAMEPVVGWLAGLPGPVRACYEAGPTGFGSVPGGEGGGDRLSGDRAVEDAPSVRGSQQVRSPRYRSAVAPADGRRVDADRGSIAHVRGGQGPGPGARAGQARLDALPAPALEAAVAPRPRVGPHRLDSRRIVSGSQRRPSSIRIPSWRSSTTSPPATG